MPKNHLVLGFSHEGERTFLKNCATFIVMDTKKVTLGKSQGIRLHPQAVEAIKRLQTSKLSPVEGKNTNFIVNFCLIRANLIVHGLELLRDHMTVSKYSELVNYYNKYIFREELNEIKR